MTQEDKKLLLKDLCARLPYHVRIDYKDNTNGKDYESIFELIHLAAWSVSESVEIKPYLRPMSSMTEDEREEFNHLYYDIQVVRDGENAYRDTKVLEWMHTDWYNAHHFDYRGLIPKGLGGGVFLAEPFKELHNRYGWKYADIHTKFRQELSKRLDEVYITRASDIYIKGVERKQLPIYHNQWYSHLMKRHK